MKPFLLALVLASFSVAGRGAQTEPPNTTVSGSAKGTFNGEPETFKTETEAIEHFQKALEQSKGGSMRAIYSAFGIVVDANEHDESFAKMAPMMRMFAAQSGALSKVDRCLGPKLGDTIQRAGYLLLYEHGFGFVDASLFHTEKGWRVLNLKLKLQQRHRRNPQGDPGRILPFRPDAPRRWQSSCPDAREDHEPARGIGVRSPSSSPTKTAVARKPSTW